MTNFRVITAIILLSSGILAACASIIDGGPTKPVRVNSAITGKQFIVRDKSGKIVHRGTTPATVNLPRSGDGWAEGQRYTISFEDGSSSAVVKSSATGWYIAGNLVFGGLIGWLLVDPITGAMYKLSPEEVSLGG
ncbi:MAG: hypothetical protein ACPGGG_06180 [Parvibaculales bacterium]